MCSKDFLLVSEMAKFSTGSVAVSGHSPEMMKKKFVHFHVYIYHFATYWFICLSTVATWFFEFFTFNIVTEKTAFILGCSESEFFNTINYHLKYYIHSS